MPVAARDWRMRKSWRWKAPLDHGPTMQGEPGDEQGHHDARGQEGTEETERAHPGGLERGHLQVAREPPAHQQHRHQGGHRQGEGEEGGEHVEQERHHEGEGARSW